MIQPTLLGVLGTNEIIIILVIVLLLFGGKKIPELMRGLGKGVRELRRVYMMERIDLFHF
jgi:sec-independent protein translocase protein TatA